MKKIIRLTESDITRIVKRVIKENQTNENFLSKMFHSKKHEELNNLKQEADEMSETTGETYYVVDGSWGMYVCDENEYNGDGSNIVYSTDSN